ncbi:MAG: DUF5399 family protein [Rhabdochlamydiaceae bacterium]
MSTIQIRAPISKKELKNKIDLNKKVITIKINNYKKYNMSPRTIDNLGIDTSNRYAQDQKLFDPLLIKEGDQISAHTEISVASPFFQSEFSSLFELSKKNSSWALFKEPTNYHLDRTLFAHTLIYPITEHSVKELINKIENLSCSLQHNPLEHEEQGHEHWLDAKEAQEQTNEKHILITFLQTIVYLDKVSSDVNVKRCQYQKG